MAMPPCGIYYNLISFSMSMMLLPGVLFPCFQSDFVSWQEYIKGNPRFWLMARGLPCFIAMDTELFGSHILNVDYTISKRRNGSVPVFR